MYSWCDADSIYKLVLLQCPYFELTLLLHTSIGIWQQLNILKAKMPWYISPIHILEQFVYIYWIQSCMLKNEQK